MRWKGDRPFVTSHQERIGRFGSGESLGKWQMQCGLRIMVGDKVIVYNGQNVEYNIVKQRNWPFGPPCLR